LIVAANLVALVAGAPNGTAASAVVFVAGSTLAFALALPYAASVLTLLHGERSGGRQAAPPAVETAGDEWLPPQAPPGPGGP
jgi:hypothetical protein